MSEDTAPGADREGGPGLESDGGVMFRFEPTFRDAFVMDMYQLVTRPVTLFLLGGWTLAVALAFTLGWAGVLPLLGAELFLLWLFPFAVAPIQPTYRAWRYVRSWAKVEEELVVTVHPGGVMLGVGEVTDRWEWAEIHTCRETDRLFMIFHGDQGLALPKESLEEGADVEPVRALMSTHLGDAADVRGGSAE